MYVLDRGYYYVVALFKVLSYFILAYVNYHYFAHKIGII